MDADPRDVLTVVICTYNRRADLHYTLDRLVDFPCHEIVVVDNATNDGTGELLAGYARVRAVRTRWNMGVPGFALGAYAAATPYVLLLDDDALPAPDVAQRVVDRFETDDAVAAIACHIVTPAGVVVTANWPDHPVLFWGCGAGIRVAVARQLAPMFYPKLRLHGTELDYCIRLYDRGFRVDYDAEAVVVHRFSTTNRTRSRRMRTVTYASVRFAWDHFRFRSAVKASARAVTSRRLDSPVVAWGWVRGIVDVVGDIPDIRRRRRVVSRMVEQDYLQAVWEYQPRHSVREARGVPARHLGGEVAGPKDTG